MTRSFLTLLLIATRIILFAQSDTTYYKDEYLQKKTTEAHANYAAIVTQLENETVIKEVRDLKKNIMLSREGNRGEPLGIWQNQNGTSLNYDFALNYTDTICTAEKTDTDIPDPFTDNPAIGYTAPKIATGEKALIEYLWKKIVYPPTSRDNDIQGRVMVRFTITKTGIIEQVAIKRNVYADLDKETMRIIRELKLSNPPMIKGQPLSICITIPVVYKLQ